eukprot:scaffold1528_cov198-Pinguiococcus_pyrenoidosus.AAC.9
MGQRSVPFLSTSTASKRRTGHFDAQTSCPAILMPWFGLSYRRGEVAIGGEELDRLTREVGAACAWRKRWRRRYATCGFRWPGRL